MAWTHSTPGRWQKARPAARGRQACRKAMSHHALRLDRTRASPVSALPIATIFGASLPDCTIPGSGWQRRMLAHKAARHPVSG